MNRVRDVDKVWEIILQTQNRKEQPAQSYLGENEKEKANKYTRSLPE